MTVPEYSMILRATGWTGKRTATEGSPEVTMSGTSARFGRIRVSGPGHRASARSLAFDGNSAATRPMSASEAIWTIRGSKAGRALASKTRATASGLKASAPRP